MDLVYFKSLCDNDDTPIVICNLNHEILYMNKVAIKSYEKRGGEKLIGFNLLNCHNDESKEKIKKVIEWFNKSKDNNIIHTFYNESKKKDVYMIALRDLEGNLIGYYEKHEMRTIDDTPFYDFK